MKEQGDLSRAHSPTATASTGARATIWVCRACGKRSLDLYGEQQIDWGWDESCAMNAIEVYADAVPLVGPRIQHIPADAVVPAATVSGSQNGPETNLPNAVASQEGT